ncbi:MAG TPA: hypothetical protein PK808_06100, partial [Polymorphobacter sp.]|nr:hypothetical protein [Polymorphobacter sp.]
PTLLDQGIAAHAATRAEVLADPAVQAIFAVFPGAELIDIEAPAADVPVPDLGSENDAQYR